MIYGFWHIYEEQFVVMVSEHIYWYFTPTPSIVVLGIAITNAAPALANPDPLVFKLSDILCLNESEVCIIHVVE